MEVSADIVNRTPARNRAGVRHEVLAALESGRIESKNLVEILAISLPRLWTSVFGNEQVFPSSLNIVAGMKVGGELLAQLPEDEVARAETHASDTVRGWAIYARAHQSKSAGEALQFALPYAKDPHFSVREWAWLAVRPQLASELDESIALLTPWSEDAEEGIRRFASEALRPKGVWCTHIQMLKAEPWKALPILEPLRSDPSRYVQNSVANWMNDASYSQPAWVDETLSRWRAESDTPETAYIVQRGRRTLDKSG